MTYPTVSNQTNENSLVIVLNDPKEGQSDRDEEDKEYKNIGFKFNNDRNFSYFYMTYDPVSRSSVNATVSKKTAQDVAFLKHCLAQFSDQDALSKGEKKLFDFYKTWSSVPESRIIEVSSEGCVDLHFRPLLLLSTHDNQLNDNAVQSQSQSQSKSESATLNEQQGIVCEPALSLAHPTISKHRVESQAILTTIIKDAGLPLSALLGAAVAVTTAVLLWSGLGAAVLASSVYVAPVLLALFVAGGLWAALGGSIYTDKKCFAGKASEFFSNDLQQLLQCFPSSQKNT